MVLRRLENLNKEHISSTEAMDLIFKIIIDLVFTLAGKQMQKQIPKR